MIEWAQLLTDAKGSIAKMRQIVIGLVLLVLAGCVAQPIDLSRNPIRRVVVVSVAGDQWTNKHVGFMVFTNKETGDDIRHWNLDSTFAARAAQAVRSVLRVEAVTPAVNPATLMSVYELTGPWDAPAFRGPNWEKVSPVLMQVARQHDADGVLLAVRSETTDYIHTTNQYLSGIGVYSHLGMRMFFAHVALHYFDAASGRVAGSSLVSRGERGGMFGAPQPPHQPVPQPLRDKRLAEMTAVEQEMVRGIMLGLLDDSAFIRAVAKIFDQPVPTSSTYTPLPASAPIASPQPASPPATASIPTSRPPAGSVSQPQEIVTRKPVPFHGRRTPDAVEPPMIAAGVRLRLTSRSTNEHGTWWYVTGGGREGWVLESDVQ